MTAMFKPNFGMLRAACLRIPQPAVSFFLRPHYALAQLAVLRSLKKLTFVEAIYLVGSGAKGKIRFGVSDLDFIVVIADTQEWSHNSELIRQMVSKLRRWFPEIQPDGEIAVHTTKEMDLVISVLRPYLFSVPGMSKLLWKRNYQPKVTTYSLSHEIPIISRLWRKILLATAATPRSTAYLGHVLERIHTELDAIAERCKLVRSRPLILTVALTAERMAYFLDKLGATNGQIFFEGTDKERAIINLLYLETIPLPDGSEKKNQLQDSLQIILATNGYAELVEAISDQAIQADYLAIGTLLFPLRYNPHARIISAVTHPITAKTCQSKYTPKAYAEFSALAEQMLVKISPDFERCQQFLLHRILTNTSDKKAFPAESETFWNVLQKLFIRRDDAPVEARAAN